MSTEKHYIFKKPCSECPVMLEFKRCRNLDCSERKSDLGDKDSSSLLTALTPEQMNERFGRKGTEPIMKVGDTVAYKEGRGILRSGCSQYDKAIVKSIEPFELVSKEGDMHWTATVKPEDFYVVLDETAEIERRKNLSDEELSKEAEAGMEKMGFTKGKVSTGGSARERDLEKIKLVHDATSKRHTSNVLIGTKPTEDKEIK